MNDKITGIGILSIVIMSAITLAGCTTSAIPNFDNRIQLENPDKILAFVGSKERIVEYDQAEDDPENVEPGTFVLHMDAGYKVRYRVLEIVHGAYEGKTIDFKAYDHYGSPPFAQKKTPLLYLTEFEGELLHIKYQYDEVYRTKAGGYAGCGDPYLSLEEGETIDRRPLVPINFDPPVVLRISDYLIPDDELSDYGEEEIRANKEWITAYFSAPAFEVDGNLATCRMGVHPDELFRIKLETGWLS